MRRLVLVVVVTLFAAALFAGPGTDAYTAARQAMRNGEPEKAEGLLEKAIAAEPNNAVYHYWLGSAYGQHAQSASLLSKMGLAKKALAALERSSQLDPNFASARFALIDFYLNAPAIAGGSEEKALKQAEELKKRDALDGHRAYARIYRHQKKDDLALKEMLTAVREQPTSAKAHHFYAAQLANRKDYKGAAEEFEAALKLDPTYMPAAFRIGHTAVVSGTNYARGEEMLKKYLTYTPKDEEPTHATAWYWLGQLYEKQGRKADAKSAYQQAQKLAPKSKDVAEALKRVS